MQNLPVLLRRAERARSESVQPALVKSETVQSGLVESKLVRSALVREECIPQTSLAQSELWSIGYPSLLNSKTDAD